MWLLIECNDSTTGPGHDEKKRYILSDYLSIAPHPSGGVAVMSLGDEVHPCTPGDDGYHCHICHKDIKPPDDCTNMVLYGDGKKFLSPVWYSCGRCKPCPRDPEVK